MTVSKLIRCIPLFSDARDSPVRAVRQHLSLTINGETVRATERRAALIGSAMAR